jgi:hypothetical protein
MSHIYLFPLVCGFPDGHEQAIGKLHKAGAIRVFALAKELRYTEISVARFGWQYNGSTR